jgi:hypothetical protein
MLYSRAGSQAGSYVSRLIGKISDGHTHTAILIGKAMAILTSRFLDR